LRLGGTRFLTDHLTLAPNMMVNGAPVLALFGVAPTAGHPITRFDVLAV
jgi:hypothetical protein